MTGTSIIAVLINFLTSEAGLTLVVTGLGYLVTFILGTDRIKKWLNESQIKKLQKAYKLLESALLAQRDTVEEMKKANGGKLSEEQKKQLEEAVIANLVDSAQSSGFDALKVIGPEFITPAITHVVRRVKGKVTGPDATALPSGTAALFPDTNS